MPITADRGARLENVCCSRVTWLNVAFVKSGGLVEKKQQQKKTKTM